MVLLLLVIGAAVALAFVAGRRISWATLAHNQDAMTRWVAAHPVAAVLLFVLAYILTAALSLPNATVLTVAGGLLFGTVLGCVLTVVGATTGASLLLVAARSALGDTLVQRGGGLVTSVRDRLQRDGFNYLLALRLVPLVPFWVVNLAAAVCGMRLRVFVPATVLGIIPDSLVLCSIGSGVGGILAEGRTPDLSVLFAPWIILPLLGLAALSLLPVLLRSRWGTHA
ncbi:TVP38/TMEM64 family protein [Rhodopila sp.]|uniref:TVP38/TMEM64 family protein n=1 Tax=Rhodopila sp. TaxID=2480087 RepID=UPI003D0F47D3